MRILLAWLVALSLAVPALATGATPPPYRLASVKAYLFYNDTGSLSQPLPDNVSLFNTIIGEGWAHEPSNAVLVRVTVAGRAGSYVSKRAVRLTVAQGTRTASGYRWGKTVLDQRQPLPVLSGTGRTVAGFWIAGTGCIPLRLTARIVGQPATAPVVRIIPFLCGE